MQNSFIVRLFISAWSARKLDKAATKDAKERSHAGDKAGVKVYKSILAAAELDAIATVANAARVEHRKRTVPWTYDGQGAITAEGYPAYKAKMATLAAQFNEAVSKFFAVYDAERESARDYLGDMFNAADYPTSGEIKGRFAFHVAAEPMPEADHFRANGLDHEVVEEIKAAIVANQDAALKDANATAWERVIEHVEKLKLKLSEYKPAAAGDKVEGRFHDTLITNIQELVTLLPSINVANDPELIRIGQKLTSLTAYTAQDLRDDAILRAEIVKQAEKILASIKR